VGRFRTGLIFGFSAGYVMGAKAGRDRYETILKIWRRVKASPSFQNASAKVGAAVGLGIERGKVVAMDGLGRATGSNRRKQDSL
jgi:hypothetical protein